MTKQALGNFRMVAGILSVTKLTPGNFGMDAGILSVTKLTPGNFGMVAELSLLSLQLSPTSFQ